MSQELNTKQVKQVLENLHSFLGDKSVTISDDVKITITSSGVTIGVRKAITKPTSVATKTAKKSKSGIKKEDVYKEILRNFKKKKTQMSLGMNGGLGIPKHVEDLPPTTMYRDSKYYQRAYNKLYYKIKKHEKQA